MKVYALGIQGPDGELTLATEPALNLRREAVEKVCLRVQALDDAIAKHFPDQQPKTFVVLTANPEWSVLGQVPDTGQPAAGYDGISVGQQ